jgi:phosphatidylinositol alpha-1,6-mannosyltransferase
MMEEPVLAHGNFGGARVLVLAPDARGIGGIQRATRSLVEACAEIFGEDRVGVLSVRAAGQPIRGRVLYEGRSETEAVGVTYAEKINFVLRSLRWAWRWRRGLTVVAAHPHLSPVARGCSRVTGAPFVVWCHGIESWGPPRRAVGAAIRHADAVFAPSRFTARRVESVAQLRVGAVHVVPHALPSIPIGDARSGRRTGMTSVVAVARLTRENRYKGIDMLLYAWPVVARGIDARLRIVGDGPDRQRLESIARLLQIDDLVTFEGRLTDDELAAVYADAALFAMPARNRLEPTPEGEGFGLVYVEAGAHRLPVIAGRGAGTEDAVQDGVSGLLVDPEDAQQIGTAILRVLGDAELASSLGAGGRELATTRYSPALFRSRLVEIIAAVRTTGAVA